jgi:hypothetical protein
VDLAGGAVERGRDIQPRLIAVIVDKEGIRANRAELQQKRETLRRAPCIGSRYGVPRACNSAAIDKIGVLPMPPARRMAGVFPVCRPKLLIGADARTVSPIFSAS